MNPKPDKVIPALYGGIIIGLISAIPFLSLLNCLCCAGVMAGGFFAVFFHKDNLAPGSPPINSGECMGIGALAGVFGAIIGTFLSYVSIALFGNVMGDFLYEMLSSMNIDLPSEAWDAIEESMSAGTTFFSMFVNLFASLIIDSLFGMLGGLIAYSMYKPKQQAMPPPAVPM